MNNLQIPENYHSPLTIRETEVAIKEVKDHFERALAKSLHLTRVSAPLFLSRAAALSVFATPVFRWFPSFCALRLPASGTPQP